ncbi:hypothetical protein HispidOSU_013257 [Sigmodon hispidus]
MYFTVELRRSDYLMQTDMLCTAPVDCMCSVLSATGHCRKHSHCQEESTITSCSGVLAAGSPARLDEVLTREESLEGLCFIVTEQSMSRTGAKLRLIPATIHLTGSLALMATLPLTPQCSAMTLVI